MFVGSTQAQLLILKTRLRRWLEELNAFDNPKQTTPILIQEQRRATYVYYILLFFGLGVLLIYNWISYSTVIFRITNPSFTDYQALEQQYARSTINCPCSQLSIRYSTFINLDFRFHSVCTSQFLSHTYLQGFFQIYSSLDTLQAKHNAFTLQGTIFSHFQGLLVLCNLVVDAVNAARQQYLASSVIAISMIDNNLFEQQTNASLFQLKSALSNKFFNDLKLIRGVSQGNALVSLYSTNWYPVLRNWYTYQTVYMQPQYYGNCSCFTSPSCTQPSIPSIPGYLVGCTPLEALLRSSIECLYGQECIDFLIMHLNLSLPSPKPLNMNETRFSSNASIDSIVQQMFIESFSSNISYNNFFKYCNPQICTVTLIKRNTVLIVLTTILGLYGGLTTFLKLVVPFLVPLIFRVIGKCKQKLHNRIHPY